MSKTLQREEKILWKIHDIFEYKIEPLTDKLESMVKSNMDEESKKLAKKLLHTINAIIRIEERQKSEERNQPELQKEQKQQLYDLELLERAVKYLATGDLSQAPEIEKREREFLHSLKKELRMLDRAA